MQCRQATSVGPDSCGSGGPGVLAEPSTCPPSNQRKRDTKYKQQRTCRLTADMCHLKSSSPNGDQSEDTTTLSPIDVATTARSSNDPQTDRSREFRQGKLTACGHWQHREKPGVCREDRERWSQSAQTPPRFGRASQGHPASPARTGLPPRSCSESGL